MNGHPGGLEHDVPDGAGGDLSPPMAWLAKLPLKGGVHPATVIRLGNWFKTWRGFWILLSLAGVAAILVTGFRPRRPLVPVAVLSQPVQIPTPMLDRLFRYVPASKSWAWFWRTRDFLFGKRQPVNLFCELFALEGGIASVSQLGLGAPTFSDATGLRVWWVDGAAFTTLRKRLKGTPGAELLSRPRMTTSDQCAASLFSGQSLALNPGNPAGLTQVGLSANFYPRLHAHSTDLIVFLALTEVATNVEAAQLLPPPLSLRTNLDFAVRLQIPKGSGVFLLDLGLGANAGRPVAVLLDPP